MKSLIFLTFSMGIFFVNSSCVDTSFAQSLQNNVSFLDQNEIYEQNQLRKPQYNPWTIHRKISAIGLAGSMATTLVGSLAMGDEFFATTVIPVVGLL